MVNMEKLFKKDFIKKIILSILFTSGVVLFAGISTFSIKKSIFFVTLNQPEISFYNRLISYLTYYFGYSSYLISFLLITLFLLNIAEILAFAGLIFNCMLYCSFNKLTFIAGWQNGGGLFGENILTFFINYLGIDFVNYYLFFTTVTFLILIDIWGMVLVYKLNFAKKYLFKLLSFILLALEKINKLLLFIAPKVKNLIYQTGILIIKGEAKIISKEMSDEYKIDSDNLKNIFSYSEDLVENKTEKISNQENVSIENNKNIETYSLPSDFLLKELKVEEVKEPDLAESLLNKLSLFSINAKCLEIRRGPVVTTYVLEPDANIKLSRILSLESDIALALEVSAVRIIAPLEGTSYIGLEVPNKKRNIVSFKNIIKNTSISNFKASIPLILGHNTQGIARIADLAKLPHLLVAGSTGTGKSVFINNILMGILYSKKPQDLKLILIDPKRLELAPYNDIPHLLFPVVTEPTKAILVLKWLLKEMERRYDLMSQHGIRNLQEKNSLELPFIVAVIDEFADLIMTSGKELEHCVVRLAQMARASGIHLVVATQRPSVDVITGLIKANFPSRVAFRVSSKVDSRTIIDEVGAECLLGNGDMLFSSSNGLERVHGAFVSDEEVLAVAEYIKSQAEPCYEAFTLNQSEVSEEVDELYQEILDYINTQDEVSISLLQRRFRIGYNRSARIVDQLEKEGRLVSTDGGKTRKVIQI